MRTDNIQYKTDVRKFCDKLRKFEYFDNKLENENNGPTETNNENSGWDLFSNPSRWQPPDSEDKILYTVINSIKSQTTQPLKKCRNKSNISFKQRKSLDNLIKNDEIVIKTADKGGATVIIDKNVYHCSLQKILDDKKLMQFAIKCYRKI